jgi:hypothetical protein
MEVTKMPYIDPKERDFFDQELNKIPTISTKGQLEYCIFKLMKTYMSAREFRYSVLHDIVYAAQHCADEFRRRYLDKREDKAREDNGDV